MRTGLCVSAGQSFGVALGASAAEHSFFLCGADSLSCGEHLVLATRGECRRCGLFLPFGNDVPGFAGGQDLREGVQDNISHKEQEIPGLFDRSLYGAGASAWLHLLRLPRLRFLLDGALRPASFAGPQKAAA